MEEEKDPDFFPSASVSRETPSLGPPSFMPSPAVSPPAGPPSVFSLVLGGGAATSGRSSSEAAAAEACSRRQARSDPVASTCMSDTQMGFCFSVLLVITVETVL